MIFEISFYSMIYSESLLNLLPTYLFIYSVLFLSEILKRSLVTNYEGSSH